MRAIMRTQIFFSLSFFCWLYPGAGIRSTRLVVQLQASEIRNYARRERLVVLGAVLTYETTWRVYIITNQEQISNFTPLKHPICLHLPAHGSLDTRSWVSSDHKSQIIPEKLLLSTGQHFENCTQNFLNDVGGFEPGSVQKAGVENLVKS